MAPYQVTIFIDGLNEAERDRVRNLPERAQISYRSIRKLGDESSSLIRLCDTLAGLLRDYEEDQPYAKPLVTQLQKNRFIKKVY